MTDKLRESTVLPAGGVKRRIRLISEGIGSSGTYPGSTLERDGAAAWPEGTQIFFDHLTESDGYERGGNHSIKDLVGVTLTDPVYEAETRALYADVKFFPNAADFINHAADYIGLSVEASGTKNDQGIVESIFPSPLNCIAVVPRAGRDGKILELVESYRETSGKISESSIPNTVKENKPMDEKDIKALAEQLAAALAPSFTALTEALKPAAPVVPEDNAEVADVAEVTEAVVEAFPTSKASRERVYEALKTNPDVAKAIADETALIESVTASLKESFEADGFTVRESKTDTHDYRVSGW
jgi:hypothetical protein